MNEYEMRQERRRQRLLNMAERLEREGNAAYKHARSLADCIPLGQPILVGHHSERRHRRDLARIESGYTRAFANQKRAERLRARAAGVGSGGVSSDDPEAVVKLREKLEGLKSRHAFMVAANKVVRAFWKAGVRDEAAGELWTRYLIKLREIEPRISESNAKGLLQPDCCGRIGFADFEIRNSGANIKRVEGRVAELGRLAAKVEAAEAAGVTRKVTDLGPYQVIENLEINRFQLKFPGKPIAAVRQVLKRNGFRWSPSEGCWQRMLGFAVQHASPGGYLWNDINRAQSAADYAGEAAAARAEEAA